MEPISVGLPFPKGGRRNLDTIALACPDGRLLPTQVRVLDRWSDGSIRWAPCDWQVPIPEVEQGVCSLVEAAVDLPSGLRVDVAGARARIETGAATFVVAATGELHSVGSGQSAVGREGTESTESTERTEHTVLAARVRILDAGKAPLPVEGLAVECEEHGPLRAAVLVRARVRANERQSLALSLRYDFHVGLAVVRVQATLRNPGPASHPGGVWELGDQGSILLEDWSFVIESQGEARFDGVSCSPEPEEALQALSVPMLLYQDSSGGDQWASPNHVNRRNESTVRFRGYQLSAGSAVRTGERATPLLTAGAGGIRIAVALRTFWERFPKALQVSDRELRVGLLPAETDDVHELQGGEQITEALVIDLAPAQGDGLSLGWARDPLRAQATPEWYCGAEAMPHLVPRAEDPHAAYLALVDAAIEGSDTFLHKRERIDEYGWRNFGDLFADHETVHHRGPEPFISHYNNQYDAIAGFAVHFFRSGDQRWFTQFEELARHVIDIDIYHTDQDKAAYSHGLFWHTQHHVNAGRATHRTYPRDAGSSGGPSAEHNYSTGLMLFYFMTGDDRARDAVLELARWVIDMDDGRLTSLRWIARGPTGLASATGSFDYHGPGRGPGNGIVTLLNAWRLSGDGHYLEKAEQLIRRCVHPRQDLAALNLLDAERRWYYTVFLQALGRYLDVKAECAAIDERYAYAQATLLHYARWMADHEYPYLDKPEILEFPTETWAAQDMRKSDVFTYAAKHTAVNAERDRFLDRARYFFDYSVTTLMGFPTRTFTRPLVLMATNGYAHGYVATKGMMRMPLASTGQSFGRPHAFSPQKTVALRRLMVAAAVCAVAATVAIAAIL